MSNLANFLAFLKERREVVEEVERQLCALQEKYESFFHEIDRARESEMEQLRALLVAPDSPLPPVLAADLEKARARAEHDLTAQLEALEARHVELREEAERSREMSRTYEAEIRAKNVELDDEEEALKERNEILLARIAGHNRRIRSLAKGFGFFVNLFRMQRLRGERIVLETEQTDVTARIDTLRLRWQTLDAEHAEKQDAAVAAWVEQKTAADAVQAKLDHVQGARERIIERTTLERVLFARQPRLPPYAANDHGGTACPRCESRNSSRHHFCAICAQRLVDDRLDLEGSLLEVAELNLHHTRFSEGIQACQELIALLRGVTSGIEAFSKSVKKVKLNEDVYPLPALRIDVPKEARRWSAVFDRLLVAAEHQSGSLHPKEFARSLRAIADEHITSEHVQAWFEGMGERLSECADSQW